MAVFFCYTVCGGEIMKIGIYLYDGYYETELCIPTMLFSKEEILYLSSDQDTVKCMDGKRVLIDYKLNEINPLDLDVLIVPGGHPILKDDILEVIRICVENGKVIGGICGGVDYFAHAGVLAGKTFASYYKKGESYPHLPVDGTISYELYESDDKIVTANPAGYLEFALELCRLAGLLDMDKVKYYEEWFKSPFDYPKNK